jgi:hypothetical protein
MHDALTVRPVHPSACESVPMKAAVVAVVLAVAAIAAGKPVRVYVYVEPAGPIGFQVVPRPLMDSARDLRAVLDGGSSPLYFTPKPDKAAMRVEVTGREEVDGEYRVHVHVTTHDGGQDLTGTSTHQWKECATELVRQFVAWAQTHQVARLFDPVHSPAR